MMPPTDRRLLAPLVALALAAGTVACGTTGTTGPTAPATAAPQPMAAAYYDDGAVSERTEEGAALAREGRLELAETVLAEAIAAAPGDALAHFNLGTAQYEQGRLLEAQGSLAKALELSPKMYGATTNLALVQVALGDLEAARRLLQQAASLAPDQAVPLANLGIVCQRMGDQACALESLRKASTLDPDNIVVRTSLADILFITDGVAAEEQYRKVLRRAPEHGPALSGLSSVLLQRRDATGAADVIAKALAALPEDATVQVNAGVLAELQGAPDKAVDHYRTALAKDPTHLIAWYDLGLVLDRLGRTEQAREAYESYLQHATDPDEAAYIRYRLSKVATSNATGRRRSADQEPE